MHARMDVSAALPILAVSTYSTTTRICGQGFAPRSDSRKSAVCRFPQPHTNAFATTMDRFYTNSPLPIWIPHSTVYQRVSCHRWFCCRRTKSKDANLWVLYNLDNCLKPGSICFCVAMRVSSSYDYAVSQSVLCGYKHTSGSGFTPDMIGVLLLRFLPLNECHGYLLSLTSPRQVYCIGLQEGTQGYYFTGYLSTTPNRSIRSITLASTYSATAHSFQFFLTAFIVSYGIATAFSERLLR